MAAVVAAAMMRAEREVVSRLRIAGATNPSAAIALLDLRGIQQRRLDWLVARGMIRQVDGDRYWLDERAYIAHETNRRRFAVIALLVVMLTLFFFIWYAAQTRPT